MFIAVCDDDVQASRQISDILDAYAGTCRQLLHYQLFENAEDMLRAAGTERFTHYFLDVMMPGMDGMAAAKEIRAFDSEAKLVFLTSFSEYAYQSYRVRAYDYLLKPVQMQAVMELLDRLCAEEVEAEACIDVRNGRSIFRIPYNRLACLEVYQKKLFFHLTDGQIRTMPGTIAGFEVELLTRPDFVKIHRSYIVNLNQVSELSPEGCILFSGKNLPVSRLLYPLIVHLPVALALILNRRARWDVGVVSIAISYALCQLPRWIGLVIQALALAEPAAVLIHLACCLLLLLLLDRFCLGAIRSAIVASTQRPLFFGAMPIAYYLYEYAVRYTQQRFLDILLVDELMPTGVVLFYVIFVIAYQREAERNRHAEQQNAALESELFRAQQEIAVLRDSAERTAVYRHDFRHHLTMIDSLLSAGGSGQAAEYIRRALGEIDALVPSRFCEHETLNLLLSAFRDKAKGRGVTLNIRASLPGELSLPDTELCTLLSNGLENALNAAAALPEGGDRTVSFFGGIKQNHLLLEIRNPYAGDIVLRDGLPISDDSRQHYGCRSIQLIAQRRKGNCSFEAADGVFVLRVAIPL